MDGRHRDIEWSNFAATSPPRSLLLVTHFSFEIDPHRVLGVGPSSTLQDIRDAYRQKAKKYHPDAGGEDWAFRILVQAYEMLSSARVVRATQTESRTPVNPRSPSAARPQRARGVGARGLARQERGAVSRCCPRAPLRPLRLG